MKFFKRKSPEFTTGDFVIYTNETGRIEAHGEIMEVKENHYVIKVRGIPTAIRHKYCKPLFD